MKRRTLHLSLFSLILLLQSALAADLQFEGVPTFSVARSKVNLVVPKIVNKSATASGAIFVQVWATETPYTGQSVSGGYILATKTLAALKPGASYNNLVLALPFRGPADGQYFTFIAIHETKANLQPVDFVNSTGTFSFVNGSQIDMEGNATWTLTSSGAVVKMTAAKIANNAYAGRSGTLQLELWATPAPYAGGVPQNGFRLGVGALSALNAGYSLSNITKMAGLKSPPGGFYYTALIVTEYTRAGNIPRDYVNVPGTFYFGGPSADAPKLDLQGPAAWSILGTTIKITVGKVINPRNGGVSGALKLNLYSMPGPYSGGPLPAEAQLLATASLGTIKGTVTLNNASRTVQYTQPSIQSNYTAVVLSETVSPAIPPVEQDYFAFASQVVLSNKQVIGLTEGALTTNTNLDRVLRTGKMSYTVTKDTLNLKLERLTSHQTYHTNDLTSPLLVRVWALPSTTNVSLTLADRYLGRLRKGASLTGIGGPIPYNKPPPGRYLVWLGVYERVPFVDEHGQPQEGYVTQDVSVFGYVNFK